jgi:hypothetical protein
MSITFTKTTAYTREDPCAICHEPLGNGEEVAIHDDASGRKHPMHEDCINRWIETRPTCPFCNADVEVEAAPVTFKDKVVRAIPHVAFFTVGAVVIAAGTIVRGDVPGVSEAAVAVAITGSAIIATGAATVLIAGAALKATNTVLRAIGI